MKKSTAIYLAAFALSLTAGVAASPLVGTIQHSDVVGTREVDSYDVAIRGGERTRFVVEGDGDSDLDCYILDSDGDVVDSDTDGTDYCIVDVYPRRTTRVTLQIRNLGVANAYDVVVR